VSSAEHYPIEHLVQALALLDERLRLAIEELGAVERDPFRGLHIADGDVRQALTQPPLEPTIHQAWPRAAQDVAPLAHVRDAFGLQPFDVAVLLLALAPDVDLRYERIYAYLQDDVTRRRPTVDLALSLLCSTRAERLASRVRLDAGAPLLRHGLVALAEPERPWLSRSIVVDEAVVRGLHGQRADGALHPGFEYHEAPRAHRPPPEIYLLATAPTPLRAVLTGPGCRDGALALAQELQQPLLLCDVSMSDDPERALALAGREAALRRAVLAVAEAPDQAAALAMAVPDRLVMLTTEAVAGTGVPAVACPAPTTHERREAWSHALGRVRVRDHALDEVASRFELGFEQIEAAARDARAAAGLHDGTVSGAGLFAAARAQSRPELGHLATRVDPLRTWSDLVLPQPQIEQLQGLCRRVRDRHLIFEDWGFGARLATGRGITALFSGAAGTGKTLAAEVIGRELGLDVYRLDLSSIVDKYIGETEKNLSKVFAAAEGSSAILLFDEADALFGKRSEVRDSHDRYANIEVSYLLQRVEEYAGVAILATNLEASLDAAFTRRLAVTVRFPRPTEEDRLRIWTTVWPAEAALAGDVDLERLAAEYALTGGHIRNAALAAAFLAAAEGCPDISMRQVLEGVRGEFAKLGKELDADVLEAAVAGSAA
jgi:hypothetical protein